jgi:hypothetical protein
MARSCITRDCSLEISFSKLVVASMRQVTNRRFRKVPITVVVLHLFRRSLCETLNT